MDSSWNAEPYLRYLAAECNRLRLSVIDPQYVTPTGESKIALVQVYTDLDVTLNILAFERDASGRVRLAQPREFDVERLAERGETRRMTALEAVSHREQPRVVLLGDPGGGKSTFVNYLAYCLTMARLEPDASWLERLPGWTQGKLLPVRVVLRDLIAWADAGVQGADAAGDRSGLRQKLATLFNKDELETLCFDLGVEHEDLPETRGGMARELIAHCERHGRIPELIAACQQSRPNVSWEEKKRMPNAQTLWDFIQHDLTTHGLGETFAPLKRQLQEQGGLVLLDGLDEVPDAQQRREFVKTAVEDFARGCGLCRIIVTCRAYAYQNPSWKLEDFIEFTLAPFSPEQIERFIGRWYEAVRPAEGWNEATAQAKANALTAAMRQPYLAELAQRPLLLTLMATLHTARGKLPDDRADLYADCVKLLLDYWQRGKVTSVAGQKQTEDGVLDVLGLPRCRLEQALGQVAFEAHQRQGLLADRRLETANISGEELRRALAPALNDSLDKANTVIHFIQTRAGLLADHGRTRTLSRTVRSRNSWLPAMCSTRRTFRSTWPSWCARIAPGGVRSFCWRLAAPAQRPLGRSWHSSTHCATRTARRVR